METLVKIPNSKSDETIIGLSLQTIVLPVGVYAELMEYTSHYPTEVSGCGLVSRQECKTMVGEYKSNQHLVHTVTYNVKEVFLPPRQKNSYSSTEIDEEMIAELRGQLIEQGKNVEELRLHWHSHVNMNTFHSGTDDDNYAGLDNGNYLISLVVNKRREVLGRVDIYSPVVVAFTNVPVFIAMPTTEEVSSKVTVNLQALDEFIKKEEKSYKVNNYRNNNNNYDNWESGMVWVDGKWVTPSDVDDKKVALLDNFKVKGDKRWDDIKRVRKIREKLREDMGLSAVLGWKFELCNAGVSACTTCEYMDKCVDYTSQLKIRVNGGKGKGFNNDK